MPNLFGSPADKCAWVEEAVELRQDWGEVGLGPDAVDEIVVASLALHNIPCSLKRHEYELKVLLVV